MIALLLTLASAYQMSASIGVTPVQKVLAMMQEMKQKGVAEKEHEAKLFEEYQTWCKDTGVTKSQEIQTATGQIERLSASIQKHEAAAVALTDEVAALDADAQREGLGADLLDAALDDVAALHVRDGGLEGALGEGVADPMPGRCRSRRLLHTRERHPQP